MAKKATPHDAQVIMQLYDLRREAEMRKARNWWGGEFWPQSADDFVKLVNAFGSQENTWLRQVSGYWDMAAAMVLHGAINEDLFLQPGISGEMFFSLAKIHPFLAEIREKVGSPSIWKNAEEVATRTKPARKLLEQFVKRVEMRRKTMAKSAKAS